MEILEYQTSIRGLGRLEDCECIVFNNDSVGKYPGEEAAYELIARINGAGIKFSCANELPYIKVYVRKKDLGKLEEAGLISYNEK
jgi:hypothetical protein